MGRTPMYLQPNGLMNLSRWRRRCLCREEEKAGGRDYSRQLLHRRVPLVPEAGNSEPPSNRLKWLTPGGAPARLRDVGNARHVMDEALAAQTIE
jgi:hypothetical protein